MVNEQTLGKRCRERASGSWEVRGHTAPGPEVSVSQECDTSRPQLLQPLLVSRTSWGFGFLGEEVGSDGGRQL